MASPHHDDAPHWLPDEPLRSSSLAAPPLPTSPAFHPIEVIPNRTEESRRQASQMDANRRSACEEDGATQKIEEMHLLNCFPAVPQCGNLECGDHQLPPRGGMQAMQAMGAADVSNSFLVTQGLKLDRDFQLTRPEKDQTLTTFKETDFPTRLPVTKCVKEEEPDCQIAFQYENEALMKIEQMDLSNTQCLKMELDCKSESSDLKKPKIEPEAFGLMYHGRVHDGRSLTKDDDCMVTFEGLPDLGSLESHHAEPGIEYSITDLIPEASSLPASLPATRDVVTVQTNSCPLRFPDGGTLASASGSLASMAVEAYTMEDSPCFSNSLASAGSLLNTEQLTCVTQPLLQEKLPFPVPLKLGTVTDSKSISYCSGQFGSQLNELDTKTVIAMRLSLKCSTSSFASTAIAQGKSPSALISSPAVAHEQRHQTIAQHGCVQDQQCSHQADRRSLPSSGKESRSMSHFQENQEKVVAHSKEQMTPSEWNLRFLLQKKLRPTDVGNLGRIILPKKDAENNLPQLITREGMIIPMTDMISSCIWEFRFRFWPNNKSRMYLLENTGEFVKWHGLHEGDLIMLYKDVANGTYVVRATKCPESNNLSTTLGKRTPLHKPSQIQGRYLSSNERQNDIKEILSSTRDVMGSECGFESRSNVVKCVSTCTNSTTFRESNNITDDPFFDELAQSLSDPLPFDISNLPKLEDVASDSSVTK